MPSSQYVHEILYIYNSVKSEVLLMLMCKCTQKSMKKQNQICDTLTSYDTWHIPTHAGLEGYTTPNISLSYPLCTAPSPVVHRQHGSCPETTELKFMTPWVNHLKGREGRNLSLYVIKLKCSTAFKGRFPFIFFPTHTVHPSLTHFYLQQNILLT